MNYDSAEPELVNRAVGGDTVALTLLLTSGRAGLCEYVGRRVPADLRGGLDADDVVQEAHSEVFRHVGDFEFRGAGSFERWVRTIALRKLRDFIKMRRADKRGGGAMQVQAVGAVGESVVMLLELMAGADRTPSRCAAGAEAMSAVRAAIELLPQDYQEAVLLVYLKGMSVEDAAVQMNRTDRAIHNLCHKAKTRLRELLGTQSRFLSHGG